MARAQSSSTIIPYDKALPEVPGRSPFTRPDAYLEKLGEGDYAVRHGRRPSTMFLVEKLRAGVDAWRDRDYRGPEISPVTRRLLQFWFEEDHLLAHGSPFRYWWAQREAIETLIYLVEGCGFTDLAQVIQAYGTAPAHGMVEMAFIVETVTTGQRLLRRWVPELEKDAVQDLPEPDLLRYALKMATGSGKTVVMALLVAWSYFHRRKVNGSTQADNFLIVAPNIIVFERLERDFAANKIFFDLPLIPPEWKAAWSLKVILRGDSAMPDPGGNLFLVNIQQIYESKQEEWVPVNPIDAILGRAPKQDLAAYQTSMLDRIKSLNSLMVLNDEAHHVHDDDLAWNQTLLALHDNLKQKRGHGLTLWIDFSATPKTQGGTYFPWCITDYPLAQAIEDQVVKAPLIVHQVSKKDPERITQDNVVPAYHDWIVVAVERWKAHTKLYKQLGQKPVLFIMCERTAYADVLAEHIRQQAKLKETEVLVIHTDSKGNLTEKYVDEARGAARDVDQPASDVKVIVSVLMLREGWDVRNVTVILGLRPFTAQADILPEQAVGRGLRLMQGLGPDRRQTLEVIGTDAFEGFIRELEHEGVGVDTVGNPPPLPIKIYPVEEKSKYDIAIPLTKPKYIHSYRNLGDLDPRSLPPIYKANVLDEQEAIEIEIAFAATGTSVHQAILRPDRPLMSQEFLAEIAEAVIRNLQMHGQFAGVYPIVKNYIRYRCFGQEVELEDEAIKTRLRDPHLQQGIAQFLSNRIATISTQTRAIEFDEARFKLSETLPFTWKRKHVKCEHTIFNECAVFNNLEENFAKFLDGARDVLRFAALAESYTRFRVDYLSPTSAIRFYYPDFVAVQNTKDGNVNWILETKGREWDDVTYKDASIMDWCKKISAQTQQRWDFRRVSQQAFYKNDWKTLSDLIAALDGIGAETAPLLK